MVIQESKIKELKSKVGVTIGIELIKERMNQAQTPKFINQKSLTEVTSLYPTKVLSRLRDLTSQSLRNLESMKV